METNYSNIKKALKNISKHLRFGGGLGLELWTASDSSWTAPRRKFEPRVPKTDGPHIWKVGGATYDRQVLLKAINESGFEVIGEYCNYNFEKWNGESNSWILELKKVQNIMN